VKSSTRIDYRARIDSVLLYLERNLNLNVAPADLARVANLSLFHFHRVFRGLTGESVMECVRRLRLESAAKRLKHSATPVTQVAFDSGFESHEGFTRAFKERFKEAPSAWRKKPSERMKSISQPVMPEVEIRETKSIPFTFISHRGSFAEVGEVWQSFIQLASEANLLIGTDELLGRYPDDPDITPMGKVRFDVGLIGDIPISAKSRLKHEFIQPGRWAVAVHSGSYLTLHETYLRLVGGWCTKHSMALGDRPCIEKYLNSPTQVSEAELRTEVWAPIE
jgi:AraC family transcriptional regulator